MAIKEETIMPKSGAIYLQVQCPWRQKNSVKNVRKLQFQDSFSVIFWHIYKNVNNYVSEETF